MTPSNGTSFPKIDFSTAPVWGVFGPPDFHAFDANSMGYWYWGDAPIFDDEDFLWYGLSFKSSKYIHDSDNEDPAYWRASLVKRPPE